MMTSNLDKLRAAARRTSAFRKSVKKEKSDDILAVDLKLGTTKLVFTEQGWKLGELA